MIMLDAPAQSFEVSFLPGAGLTSLQTRSAKKITLNNEL